MKKKIIYIHQVPYTHGSQFAQCNLDNFFHFGLGRLILDNLEKSGRKVPYEFENWRMDPGIKSRQQRVVNGVKCRIFPARCIKKIGAFSFSFFKNLKNESKNNKILIHTSSSHGLRTIFAAYYLRKFPMVVTHIGGSNPLLNFKLYKRFYSYFTYLLEKITFRYIDMFSLGVPEEINYFSRIVGDKKISYGPSQGIASHFVDTEPASKKIARKKLNIPENKQVILTVGRLDKLKGSDETLKVFIKLKKSYDVMWIAVGTNEENPYYQKAKDEGVTLLPYISREEGLRNYFCAADVYSYPMYHIPLVRKSAGIGVATVEALFCNLPYVGNGIEDLPDNYVHQCGIAPNNTDELYQGIKKAFDHPEKFGNTREIVMKYYTWEKVLDRYLSIYEGLFEKYYS